MYQEFNGVKYFKNSKTGYWERSHNVYPRRMHQAVWIFYNGAIPDGYAVHHIDHNKDNNVISNLQLLSHSEHAKVHEDNLRTPEAMQHCKAWHDSEDGRQFHSMNGKITSSRWEEKEYTCIVCGRKFTVKSPRTDYKFCSNKCKSQYRRDAGLDNEVRVCAKCGQKFVTNKYSKTVCCSRQCAAQLRWDKKHQESRQRAYL